MPPPKNEPDSPDTRRLLYRLAVRLAYSRLGEIILRLPPMPWLMRQVGFNLAQRLKPKENTTPIPLREAGAELVSSLNEIVYDVVEVFGFAGAMVAPYERGDVLPVRAIYLDPGIATLEQVRAWEVQISSLTPNGRPVSLSDPNIARVYVHDERYQLNLSAQAARAGTSVISDELFDLFTPIAPIISRDLVKGIQAALGIEQVIAVPFFLDTSSQERPDREYVGNLFVAKRGQITTSDQKILATFAHFVAASILSERRRLQSNLIQALILDMQRDIANEEAILARIAQGMVTDLGYVAAMVATYEQGILPVRAIYIDPHSANLRQLADWDAELAAFNDPEHLISLSRPNIMQVLVHDDRYQGNLGVKASAAGRSILSDELFDLFIPAITEPGRKVMKKIQAALGIKQVIAVPFFLDQEYVGNLFAATRSEKFSNWEIDLLQAFGQQAAVGLRNARLYKQSENRREASYILGRMAFSASTSIHTFRNHLGVIRSNLQLLTKVDQLYKDESRRQEVLGLIVPPITSRLNQLTEILDSLHSPWNLRGDAPVEVNACLRRALLKVEPALEDWATLSFQPDLPAIVASNEILTEIFATIIKNAVEALAEKGQEKIFRIETRQLEPKKLEILFADEGIGIRPENLIRIFEMRYTTKSTNLGFGLFWAKDYIEGIGGKILVESEWKKGTTVRVHLPTKPRNPITTPLPINKIRNTNP